MHILDEFLQNVTINLFDYDICRLFSSLCTKEVHTYKEQTHRGTEMSCSYKLRHVRHGVKRWWCISSLSKNVLKIWSKGFYCAPLCPIHVVTFTLISNLATDYIQKRRGQALLFSFEYNLLPNLISDYMDRALASKLHNKRS